MNVRMMKIYSAAELAEIIKKHGRWLRCEDGGERANLSRADLSFANLREANLRGADLSFADLSRADLSRANLSFANLIEANLSFASLSFADLRKADLSLANLSKTNLSEANLSFADLSKASLSKANLSKANLHGANGNLAEVRAIQCDLWPVTYTATHMEIGCQRHQIAVWWVFDDTAISSMDGRALEWWRVWKPILQQIIAAAPATPYLEDKQ